MINLSKELETRFAIIEKLNQYSIEFGILTEDKFKKVQVNVLNTDDTETKIDMDLGDVMYLTEHGTLTIPARPILELTLKWVNNELDKIIDKIIDGVIKFNWTNIEVERVIFDFGKQIELYAQSQAEQIITSNSVLSSLLNMKDENKYLFDLRKLKYYIKCKIIKN